MRHAPTLPTVLYGAVSQLAPVGVSVNTSSWEGVVCAYGEWKRSLTLSLTIHSIKFAGPFCGQEKG